jgi:hypothetical protein
MILENKVKAIVMLTELEEKSKHGKPDYKSKLCKAYFKFQFFTFSHRLNSDANFALKLMLVIIR